MNPFSMWDTIKTGTGLSVIVGGVGVLLSALAYTISGHMSWFTFGAGALGIIGTILAALRQRKAVGVNTALTQATADQVAQIHAQITGAAAPQDFPPLARP
jgi:hypothetical protein